MGIVFTILFIAFSGIAFYLYISIHNTTLKKLSESLGGQYVGGLNPHLKINNHIITALPKNEYSESGLIIEAPALVPKMGELEIKRIFTKSNNTFEDLFKINTYNFKGQIEKIITESITAKLKELAPYIYNIKFNSFETKAHFNINLTSNEKLFKNLIELVFSLEELTVSSVQKSNETQRTI